jgi:EmrB/QacA subfamily drug resistance transporter
VTAALVLGAFVSALEATAVATAMPTAIADLGGVSRYSWVFSAYLLTSTTTVPLFGKLADLYGRQRVYLAAMALFLLGTGLTGAATSLEQMIAFRALQGLGAGGVMPLSATILGDIYSLEERGRVQGVFSGVWGLSSIVGPALGGVVTDLLSWRWVFYSTIPFGVGSVVLLRRFLDERGVRREHSLDVLGTVALTLAIALLLTGLLEGSEQWGWTDPRTFGAFAGSLVCFALFVRQERRAPEPMFPAALFRQRLIAVSNAGSAIVGTLLLAATAYVPMYAQGVLGGSATEAGAALTPMLITWPIAALFSGRALLRFGYRPLIVAGGLSALVGTSVLAWSSEGGRLVVTVSMAFCGMGLGLMSTPYLVAVQNAVPWRQRGMATSVTQFFRTIGGALAVAVFGALLNARLAPVLGEGTSLDAVLDPKRRATLSPDTLHALTGALGDSLHAVFIGFAVVGAAGLLIAWMFPGGAAAEHAHPETRQA